MKNQVSTYRMASRYRFGLERRAGGAGEMCFDVVVDRSGTTLRAPVSLGCDRTGMPYAEAKSEAPKSMRKGRG
jgi:hypothetical protein